MKMRKLIPAMIIALLLSFIFAGAENDFSFEFETETETRSEKQGEDMPAGENSRFSLTVNTGNGCFSVKDKQSDKIWYSNPPDSDADTIAKGLQKTDLKSQLSFYGYNEKIEQMAMFNSYASAVKKGGIDVETAENGFTSKYHFYDEQIEISLSVKLTDNGVSVTVPAQNIEENGEYRIFNMSLLPLFGAGTGKDDGFMFVPSGTGAVIDYRQPPSRDSYFGYVYGNDLANSLKDDSLAPRELLPVFGVSQNGNGFLGILGESAEFAMLNASVSGQLSGYGTVYPSFALRKYKNYDVGAVYALKELKLYEKEPIKLGDVTVDYCFLPEGKSGYADMAAYYSGTLSLKQQETRSAAVVELLCATAKTKSFFGIPYTGIETLTTFNECQKIAEELKSGGAGSVSYILGNISSASVKGGLDKAFSPIGGLGGKKGLESFTEKQKEHGGDVYIEYEPVVFSGGFFAFMDAAREISGQLLKIKKWHPGIERIDDDSEARLMLKSEKLEPNVRKYIKSLGSAAPGLAVNAAGNALYTDFGNKKTTISDTLNAMTASLELMSENGKLLSRNANLYAAGLSSLITDLPGKSSGQGIITRTVPFYEIVMSGKINYSYQSVNLQSNFETQFLKTVETGAALKYTWIYRDASKLIDSKDSDLFSADYRSYKDRFLKQYGELEQLRKKTGNGKITAHRMASDGVFETEYENGAVVTVDYNEMTYKIT